MTTQDKNKIEKMMFKMKDISKTLPDDKKRKVKRINDITILAMYICDIFVLDIDIEEKTLIVMENTYNLAMNKKKIYLKVTDFIATNGKEQIIKKP